jgi:hypothetical protein
MYLTRVGKGVKDSVIADMFDFCESGVGGVCEDVATAIVNAFVDKQIRLPTDEELMSSQATYVERFGLLGCVGAIDGTHIRHVPETAVKDAHYNHKGFHSFHMHACCDNKCVHRNTYGVLCCSMRVCGDDHPVSRCSQFHHLGSARRLARQQR